MGNSFSVNLNDIDNGMNTTSNNTKTTSLIDYVDMIATNYILKQNMIDMIRFTDKEYYDNMIILTSYIMKNQLNNLDIGILKNRVIEGYRDNNNNGMNENMYVANTNKLREITMKNEKMKQKSLMIISKFYIKIMTLFSAIVATIDPQYVYEDDEGNKRYFNLREYNSYKKLDKESKELRISRLDNPMGLVKKRLAILKNKLQHKSESNTDSEYIVLNPGEKFCEENTNGYKLNDEIGIQELDVLYFDEFDYETNTWNKRSKIMQQKYDEDVLTFYQIFTGIKEKPEFVKTFADIETLQFHQLKRCVNKDHYQDLLVSKKDTLFQKYMEKIYMIQNITKSYKRKMLHILKQVIVPSQGNSDTSFTIAPSLQMELLLGYQDDVRNCINQIYLNCERLFIEALILYEKMYEKQHGVLVEKQINHMENNQNNQNNQTKNQNESQKENSTESNVTLDANALATPLVGNSPQIESLSQETPMNELSPTPSNTGETPTNNGVSPNAPPTETPMNNGVSPNAAPLETPMNNGVSPNAAPLETPANNDVSPNAAPLETPANNGVSPNAAPLETPANNGVSPNAPPPSANSSTGPLGNENSAPGSGILETPEESPMSELNKESDSGEVVKIQNNTNNTIKNSIKENNADPSQQTISAAAAAAATVSAPETPANNAEIAAEPQANHAEVAAPPAPQANNAEVAPPPAPQANNAEVAPPPAPQANNAEVAPPPAPQANNTEAAAPAPQEPESSEVKEAKEIAGGTQDILHRMRSGIRGFLSK